MLKTQICVTRPQCVKALHPIRPPFRKLEQFRKERLNLLQQIYHTQKKRVHRSRYIHSFSLCNNNYSLTTAKHKNHEVYANPVALFSKTYAAFLSLII